MDLFGACCLLALAFGVAGMDGTAYSKLPPFFEEI